MREARAKQHQAIYATPNLPAFQFDLVTLRIWAGRNPLTALDVEELQGAGVTHILDLREPHEWAPPRYGQTALVEIERVGLTRLHLPITDMGAPTAADLEASIHFMDDVLNQPETGLYVHCRAGMERTAAVLIAWWVRKHGASYEAALAALRQGRPILKPLPVQEAALRRWIAVG